LSLRSNPGLTLANAFGVFNSERLRRIGERLRRTSIANAFGVFNGEGLRRTSMAKAFGVFNGERLRR
jgi:predicted outer membrane lipoprotein